MIRSCLVVRSKLSIVTDDYHKVYLYPTTVEFDTLLNERLTISSSLQQLLITGVILGEVLAFS